MKTFSDKLEKIEIKLIDNEGIEIIKTAKFLSVNDIRALDKLQANSEKDVFENLCEQLAYVFGGKAKDYMKYSFPLLHGIMDYVKEVFLKNPIMKAQK